MNLGWTSKLFQNTKGSTIYQVETSLSRRGQYVMLKNINLCDKALI